MASVGASERENDQMTPYGAPRDDCIFGSCGIPGIVWEARIISLNESHVVFLDENEGTRAVTLKKWKKYHRARPSTYKPNQNLTIKYNRTPYRHPPAYETTTRTIIIDDVFSGTLEFGRTLRLFFQISSATVLLDLCFKALFRESPERSDYNAARRRVALCVRRGTRKHLRAMRNLASPVSVGHLKNPNVDINGTDWQFWVWSGLCNRQVYIKNWGAHLTGPSFAKSTTEMIPTQSISLLRWIKTDWLINLCLSVQSSVLSLYKRTSKRGKAL